MAVKLVDKVLSFMGFEEEAVEEDTKFNREEEPEEQPWRRKRDRFREKEKAGYGEKWLLKSYGRSLSYLANKLTPSDILRNTAIGWGRPMR